MHNQTYSEQIEAAYNRARRAKNVEAMAYYSSKEGTSACASFETFKGSWAYEQWKAKPETQMLIQGIRLMP